MRVRCVACGRRQRAVAGDCEGHRLQRERLALGARHPLPPRAVHEAVDVRRPRAYPDDQGGGRPTTRSDTRVAQEREVQGRVDVKSAESCFAGLYWGARGRVTRTPEREWEVEQGATEGDPVHLRATHPVPPSHNHPRLQKGGRTSTPHRIAAPWPQNVPAAVCMPRQLRARGPSGGGGSVTECLLRLLLRSGVCIDSYLSQVRAHLEFVLVAVCDLHH